MREKGERRYKMDVSTRDVYNHYKEHYNGKISYAMFNKMCKHFNLTVADRIIRESLEFKLPFKLGSIRIRAAKIKIKLNDNGRIDTVKMAIDWPSTKKMWREMYPDKTMKEIYAIPNKKLLVYTNDHSNGYIMRWWWDKRLVSIKNQGLYVFKPVKGRQDEEYYHSDDALYHGRRGLAKWIKNDDRINEYFE